MITPTHGTPRIIVDIMGDSSILITKSILDASTAAFSPAALGYSVAVIVVRQVILLVLAYLGSNIVPLANVTMLSDLWHRPI